MINSMLRPGSLPRAAALAAAALLTASTAAPGQAITDNFDDGDDAGWTRIEPLADFGAGGTYTFPGGAYQISAPASPNPGALGPSRVGALREDAVFSDFTASVDVVAWDGALGDQVFGFLARLSNVGLGTTDGYALTLGINGSLDLSLVADEAASGIGDSASIGGALNPAVDYRIVLSAAGSSITGSVFDTANLSVPLASVSASDGTHSSGTVGLIIFDNSGGGNQATGATFDNFSVAVPEPAAAAALAGLAAAALLFRRRGART